MILGKLQNGDDYVEDVEFEKLRVLVRALLQLLSQLHLNFDDGLQSLLVEIFLEPLRQTLEDLRVIVFVHDQLQQIRQFLEQRWLLFSLEFLDDAWPEYQFCLLVEGHF